MKKITKNIRITLDEPLWELLDKVIWLLKSRATTEKRSSKSLQGYSICSFIVEEMLLRNYKEILNDYEETRLDSLRVRLTNFEGRLGDLTSHFPNIRGASSGGGETADADDSSA